MIKKRFFAALLTLAMALTLVPAVHAAGFSDVKDTDTARDVEVLRLMGVVQGDGNGTFRPGSSLTRAEFCKMTIELQQRGDQAMHYRGRVIFPDVRASHWAIGYVNLASQGTGSGESAVPGLVHGFPDGTFQPDKTISYGEAVTVLARVLGYSDTYGGGVWPQNYLDIGAACGLTKGLSLDGGAQITRAQAAKLFVNALRAEKLGGGNILKLGDEEVTLLSVDVAKETMRLSSGSPIKMVNPDVPTVLLGTKGYVVMDKDGKKALTFLPSASKAGTPVADAAIIIMADGSTDGFNELTGDAKDYTIYRNGVRATRGALRKYDVAIYDAANNAVLVTDTRVSAYYESCDPSPKEPRTITTLGTVFNVIPSAQQSLSELRPGQHMTVLFAADGRIAGALGENAGVGGNAYAYVDDSGKVSLICGGSLLALSVADAANANKVGRISQHKADFGDVKVSVSVSSGGLSGVLDTTAGKLGNLYLADNALILSNGKLVALAELTETSISSDRIRYAHENSSGKVDIVVIGDPVTVSGEVYGRVTTVGGLQATVDCGPGGKVSGRYGLDDTTKLIREGSFVAAVLRTNGAVEGSSSMFNPIEPLTAYENVPASAWIGKTAVVLGGRTISIPSSVLCWNADTKSWFSDLDTALDYGGTRNVYVKDNVVRVIEIRT